jgi:hypothetical protein
MKEAPQVPEGIVRVRRPSPNPFNEMVGPSSFVTVNLSLDFAGSAKLGDWVESAVEVHKTGARLAFANGYLAANGVNIVRASAICALATSPK